MPARIYSATDRCKIPECGKKIKCGFLCSQHDARLRIYGDPLAPLRRAKSGTGYIRKEGYRMIGEKMEHVIMVEKVLGKRLPKGALVHHVNHKRADNRNENFVVCPSDAYHLMLHQRERALDACGNANWRKCTYCQQYDDPTNLKNCDKKAYPVHHAECARLDAQRRRAKPRRVSNEQ